MLFTPLFLTFGFGLLTIYFKGGAHNLMTMLSPVHLYEHDNLCPFWPGIGPGTSRLIAARLAFYHYAEVTIVEYRLGISIVR